MNAKFNINENVFVKLTDIGRAELKRQHDEWASSFPQVNLPEWSINDDPEGWSKWQMWSLMGQLGHLCQLGFEQPFDVNIKIELSK